MTPEALARVLANYFLLPVDDLMRGPMGRNLVPKLLAAITPAPAPMTPPSERAKEIAADLVDRVFGLKPTGMRGSAQEQEVIEALDAFAAEAVRAESGLTWVAAEMLVALVARDVERLHDGDFKLGMEFACEEILERMKAGPDSVQTTQATDKLRARTPASGEEGK